MPQGGKEHFIRKTSGIITSYYQIALIKIPTDNPEER